MRTVTIGWSSLDVQDAAMGTAHGTFRPGPGYDLVQPIFRLFTEAEGNIASASRDETKLARYYAARDRLGLTLHDPDGGVIPVRFIHIVDYTEEEGPAALELQVAVDSPVAWQALVGSKTVAEDV